MAGRNGKRTLDCEAGSGGKAAAEKLIVSQKVADIFLAAVSFPKQLVVGEPEAPIPVRPLRL
jgi:hypothetical protein